MSTAPLIGSSITQPVPMSTNETTSSSVSNPSASNPSASDLPTSNTSYSANHNVPMEIDQETRCLDSVSTASLIFLHPLVAMNIADHATRCTINDRPADYALGVLLGKQNGREIDITNSFDVCYDVVDDSWILNRDFLDSKLEQIAQVMPDCDVVGWYALGDVPAPRHKSMHTQVSQVNESSILLMFDPRSEELSIKTYETKLDVSDNESRMLFVEVQYTIKTTEAERIGVDHAVGASVSGLSAVSDVLGSHKSSIEMLDGRVKIISDYINLVKSGAKKHNPEIMRAIASLVSSLPLASEHSDKFDTHSQEELVDALLITSLATLTKGFMTHDEVAAKSHVVHAPSISSKKVRNIDMMGSISRNLPL